MRARMPSGPNDVGSIEADDGQSIARVADDYIDFGKRAVLGLKSGGKVITRLDQLDTTISGKELEEIRERVHENAAAVINLTESVALGVKQLFNSKKETTTELNELTFLVNDKVTVDEFKKLRAEVTEMVAEHKEWVEKELAALTTSSTSAYDALHTRLEDLAEVVNGLSEPAANTPAAPVNDTNLAVFREFIAAIATGASAKQAALNTGIKSHG